MLAEPAVRDSAAMNERRPNLRLVPPNEGLPENVIVLPLESTIPPEMTLHEWRHRNVTAGAKRRSRRVSFLRPVREAA
jgi:hypothetical protein